MLSSLPRRWPYHGVSREPSWFSNVSKVSQNYFKLRNNWLSYYAITFKTSIDITPCTVPIVAVYWCILHISIDNSPNINNVTWWDAVFQAECSQIQVYSFLKAPKRLKPLWGGRQKFLYVGKTLLETFTLFYLQASWWRWPRGMEGYHALSSF